MLSSIPLIASRVLCSNLLNFTYSGPSLRSPKYTLRATSIDFLKPRIATFPRPASGSVKASRIDLAALITLSDSSILILALTELSPSIYSIILGITFPPCFTISFSSDSVSCLSFVTSPLAAATLILS